MQRDMDLVRKILLAMNDDEGGSPLEIEGYTKVQIGFHVAIMAQAGLLRGIDITNHGHPQNWLPIDITWEGYEFIAKIRDESIWNKLKKLSLEKTGGLGYEFIKAIGTRVITDVVTTGKLPGFLD